MPEARVDRRRPRLDDRALLRSTSLPLLAAGCALSLAVACGSDGGGDAGPGAGATGSGGQGAGAAGGDGGAPPGDCVEDADCDATQNACAIFACDAGACVPSFLPAGTPVPSADVAGDCQRRVCDGAGTLDTEADADDTSDDLNPCTDDGCEAGAPSHTPVMDATPCGSGEATVCEGGVCVGCAADAECPPGDGCRDPVCDARGGGPGKGGMCGLVISVGKEVGNAAPDDCTHAICNAAGAVEVVANPVEAPPQDAQTCDTEVCGDDGLVAHVPLRDGVLCDGTTFCNPSLCAAAVCTEMADPAAGTVVPGGAGECASTVCDGAGLETTAFAPAGTGCQGFGVCDGAGNCSF